MISNAEIEKIKEMYTLGIHTIEIAKVLSRSVPSIYKYIKLIKNDPNFLLDKEKKDISNKIKPFIENINNKLDSGIYNNTKIYKELRQKGFIGSYGLLNKYIQKKKEENLSTLVKSYQKVETGPGEQAQVDWGHFGKININGKKLNLYVFVFVLSYSRAMYAEFVTSQKQQVFQNCHINAFKKLGVPKKIRYDNVKTVVISRHRLTSGKEQINYNFDFINFSKYYKFEPELCPVYYPRSKGKVEAGVKYLRHNFMSGEVANKTFKSIDDINIKLHNWLNNVANDRIHATTKQKPKDLWLKEEHMLFIVNDYPHYKNTYTQSRWSSQNAMVTYKKSSYGIPTEFARKKIDIEEKTENGVEKLHLFFKGLKIAEHIKSDKPGGWFLPHDYGKRNKKGASAEERVTSNPIYKIDVEIRDINYYNKFI